MRGWLLVLVLIVAASDAIDAQPRVRSLIRQFLIVTGYPNGRPGHVVDHQIPICAGGPDSLTNLQWQERQASYRKDVFERALCADMKRLGLIMVKK